MKKAIIKKLKALPKQQQQWLWFVGLWFLGLGFVIAVKIVWQLLAPLLP